MHCLRQYMYWQKQKTLSGRGLNKRAAEEGDPENCSARQLAASGFMVIGWASMVVSGQSSCSWPYLVPLRVLPLVHASHRQDGFWSVSRRLTRHIMDRCSLLLSGPSWILLAGSVDSPMFLIKPLLLWHTHASSDYHAWPRQAVLVSGSLT